MKNMSRLLASLTICVAATTLAATLTTQSPQAAGKATIQTDSVDYPPNTQVNVTGGGWLPGEVVELTFTETATTPPGGFTDGPFIFYATSDAQGDIANGGFQTDQHDLGVHFLLTAKGTISGKTAQTTFTDDLPGLFEISDGNTVAVTSHDWNQVWSDKILSTSLAGTGALQFTTDGPSAADDTFSNSPKDIQDINTWRWGLSKASTKTDLAHGFAAAYQDSGHAATYGASHSLLFVGTDRVDNGSNAAVSIWFLQHPITKKSDGTFANKTGGAEVHVVGDLLIQASLGSGLPIVTAYAWDPVVSATNPTPPLKPITLSAAQSINAINLGTITVPWSSSSLLAQEFFEVGLDLNEVFKATSDNLPDFSSFIITSRVSVQQTATLVDFILGDVSSGADITVLNTPIATPVNAEAQAGFTVTVKNVGVGTVTGVTLSDPLPLSVNWSISGPNPAGFLLSAYDGVAQQILTLPASASVPFNTSLSVQVTGLSTSGSRPSIASTATVTAGNEGPDFTTNNSATGTIYVNNNAPTPVNDTRSTTFNTTTTYSGSGAVLVNDIDLDGDSLTVATVKESGGSLSTVLAAGTTVSASHGTITIYPDGHFTYAPTPGSTSNDSFQYTVKDSQGQVSAAAATVTITIGTNNPPDALNDSATVDEDSTNTAISVLANDTTSDPGETLSVTAAGPASHGTVTLTAGLVTYTPTANYYGSDSFTYTISDGNGGSDTATVSITVTNVNDTPVANADSKTVDEDTVDNAVNVLANDTDTDNVAPTAANAGLTVVAVGSASHGTVSFTAGGVTYTPAANFHGTDTFTYTVSDNGTADAGHTSQATVTMTVTNVNDAPANVIVNSDTLDENDFYDLSGSFTDADSADSHTVTIHWGDGSTDTIIGLGVGVTAFAAPHQYLDDNASDSYAVTVSVVDNSGAGNNTGNGGATVTVHNAAPIVVMSASPITLSPGDAFSRPGSFFDAGTVDSWSATVDYGDLLGPQPLTLSGKTFSLTSPAYATPGVYTVTVSVTDDDGGVGNQSFYVNVGVPAVAIVHVEDQTVSKGSLLSMILPFSGSPNHGYASSINWGDSSGAGNAQTGSMVTNSSGAGTVAGSHTYNHKGTYTVFVTVTDSSTGVSDRVAFQVTVN